MTIDLKDYRLVTDEEKKKYPKPDCAVYTFGAEKPNHVNESGEWDNKTEATKYYVPLGFQFEPEQPAEPDYKAAIERIVSKIRTAKNLPVADNDYIRGTDFGLTLALRIINEEIK